MNEELVIKVGDEINDEVGLGSPDLGRRKHRRWGNPERDDVRIIFSQKAYAQASTHAQSEPRREVGGVLLGKVYRAEGVTYVEITETLAAPLTAAGATELTFTLDSWSAINRERERRFPGLTMVGWYHTHPRMAVFLSGADVFLHQNFFPQPWHVALVIEPYSHQAGFFIPKAGQLVAATGFYELFDQAQKSMVTWRLPPTPTAPVAAPDVVSVAPAADLAPPSPLARRVRVLIVGFLALLLLNLAGGWFVWTELTRLNAERQELQTLRAELGGLQEQQRAFADFLISHTTQLAAASESCTLKVDSHAATLSAPGSGSTLRAGQPVQFVYQLHNMSQANLQVTSLTLHVEGPGQAPEWLQFGPLDLGSGASETVTAPHTFSAAGVYTATLVARGFCVPGAAK
jgi:proteasome lid subunit RPN8/RPN11